jgi:hypothetical protein
MREILFRGKNGKGEWLYGYFVNVFSWRFDDEQGKLVEHYTPSIYPEGEFRGRPVVPATVGQYTGLLDKNGVKIFEGDIIESHQLSGEFLRRGVVEFVTNPKAINCGGFAIRESDGRFGGFYQSTIWFPTDEPANLDTVLGNIHDNPELLEG